MTFKAIEYSTLMPGFKYNPTLEDRIFMAYCAIEHLKTHWESLRYYLHPDLYYKFELKIRLMPCQRKLYDKLKDSANESGKMAEMRMRADSRSRRFDMLDTAYIESYLPPFPKGDWSL